MADAAPGPPRRSPGAARRGGVSVIAGGLLQDLEDRLRRDLAPIEERVRPGAETRGLAGDLVIVIPGTEPDPDRP